MLALCIAAGLSIAADAALAVEIRFEPVAEGVYAIVGETGPRTPGNEGLTANIGLVVTPSRAVLIDSGATWQGTQHGCHRWRGALNGPAAASAMRRGRPGTT